MELPTLQDRRERGDPITLYKRVNGIEKTDKQDLELVTEEAGRTRGHVKKIRKRNPSLTYQFVEDHAIIQVLLDILDNDTFRGQSVINPVHQNHYQFLQFGVVIGSWLYHRPLLIVPCGGIQDRNLVKGNRDDSTKKAHLDVSPTSKSKNVPILSQKDSLASSLRGVLGRGDLGRVVAIFIVPTPPSSPSLFPDGRN
ncbi:hypothetical protein E2C01_014912 [Portunus trituberculatus]|uniref:Uncharacterized protein n=1 Tax=Portunus trituberculatus TaxID=210409 RepID=A0A5B7DKB0_PORTR|nr:hypothetical protein [Portunus trituberculatus]